MRKIKQPTFLLAFALATGWSVANAQESLLVYSKSSSQPVQSVALEEIVKLTLDGEAVTIHTADSRTSTFKYEDILSLKFDQLTTGIASPAADKNGLNLYYRNGCVEADGLKEASDATVYDLGGRIVLTQKQWDGAPVNITLLGKGVYLFKVNNNVIKITLP